MAILSNLILSPKEKQTIGLDKIHFSSKRRSLLDQLLKEFEHLEVLSKYNLPVDNKVL